MPRVSVLLTCYNHIAYLPSAVVSVKAQSFTDYELIAIDDGSTDGTREWLVANGIAAILNEKNLGTYASLNVALKEAKGEYIAILNDDDLWARGKLEAQVRFLDEHPEVGIVHTDGGFIDGEGKPMAGSPLGFEFPCFESGDVLLDLVYQNKIIASGAVVRRECFEKLGSFNEAYFGSGDWEMWFRIAEQWQVGFVPEKLTLYRVHGGNASHKLERIWQDDERLRTWMAERLENIDPSRFPPEKLRDAKAHNWASLGTVLTLNGEPAAGREAYARSMRLMPSRVKSYLRFAATFLPKPLFRRLL